eukprot:12630637-Alexandrium_andersonii.AAC.1
MLRPEAGEVVLELVDVALERGLGRAVAQGLGARVLEIGQDRGRRASSEGLRAPDLGAGCPE